MIEDQLHMLAVKNEAGMIEPEEIEWMLNVLFLLTQYMYDDGGTVQTVSPAGITEISTELNKCPGDY